MHSACMNRRNGWTLLVAAILIAGCTQRPSAGIANPAPEAERADASPTAAPLPIATGTEAPAVPDTIPTESDAVSLYNLAAPEEWSPGTGRINSLAYSPTGEWIAAASADGSIYLRPARAGGETHLLEGHEGQVSSIAFSPDGQTLASGGVDGTLRLWRVEDGALFREVDSLLDHIYRVVYAPDGTALAVGGSLCQIEIRDARLGLLLQTLTQPHCVSSDGWPTSWALAFSPDRTHLLTGEGRACCGSTVQIFSRVAGQLGSPTQLRGIGAAIQDLAFSPDGTTVAVATTSAVVELWSVESQSLIHKLEGHSYRVYDVDLSADGRFLASASRDGTVRVWDVESGELLRTLETDAGPATAVAFSPAADQLICGTETGVVLIWVLTT